MESTNNSQQWHQSSIQQSENASSGSIFDEEESRSNKNKNKKKPIRKQKNKRNTQSIRWTKDNILNYFKAVLQFSIQHPYYKISWQYWKPQKFYQRIVNFINRNQILNRKTIIQTKSFDERLRKQNFQKEISLDIIDLAKMKLKECQSSDAEAEQILFAYKQQQTFQSDHMMLLKRNKKFFNEKKVCFKEMYSRIKNTQKTKANVQIFRQGMISFHQIFI